MSCLYSFLFYLLVQIISGSALILRVLSSGRMKWVASPKPILVIKPFDDEKLVRLLFNMRKREEWRVVGVYVLHQQPHTFL